MARTANGGGRAPFSSATTTKKSKPTRANRASKNDPANAYTYEPSLPKRHRTSEQQNSLTYEETKAGPSSPRRKSKAIQEEDEEDDEELEMEERIRKLQRMIASDAPGEIDEDSEESEVDSDDAWGSEGSDEERWGDVFRDLQKGKAKKGKKGKEVVLKPAKLMTVDLDETDDEAPAKNAKVAEEDEESEDEFAADREEASDEDDEDVDEEDDNDDDEDEDEDEGSEAELPSDLSEDEGPDTLEGLDSFVDELDAADRKKRDMKAVKAEVGKTKRRVLPVSSGPQASNGKLDLSTLIASHPSLSGASGLLPSKADNKSSSSILKQGVLPAPLPTIVQDRLDREAAYEKTKEEGQKWSAAMKRIKEAEHLQFPLQSKERGGVKSSGEVIGSFKAQNQFEDAITSLLKSANLTESAVTKREDEELQGQELSMEEIKARREKLAYQRELMFRAESKAKRISKIKSKTYRKLARKRAAKEGGGDLNLEDLEKLDPEAAAHERDKLERDRARERATLRHGAKSGRWARDQTQGGEGEMEDRRRAREEMLDIKEKLQRKIQGKDDGDSSDSDSEDDNDEDDEEAIREKAFSQLSALDKPVQSNGKKGLMDMAFMKKAQDREMKRVAEDEKQAREDIENYGNDNSGNESDGDDSDKEAIMERVGGNEGRMVFAPTKPNANAQGDLQARPKVQEKAAEAPKQQQQPFKSALSQPTPDENPWLASTISSAGPSRKKNATVATDKASRQLAKSAAAREAVMEDERVDIAIDAPVTHVERGQVQGKKRKVDEEDEEEDGMLPNGLKGFKQRDLVAEAFAGDDVVQDFAAEKARQTEADAPTTKNTALPGWNSWGGKGAKKSKKNPKFLVKTAGIEPALRKDFTTSNVIITEKKDRKAAAFQVKDLPYPYTSIEQFEARFKTPLGSEWNSRAVHQKETMPRVVKKPGAIIEPVRRLF